VQLVRKLCRPRPITRRLAAGALALVWLTAHGAAAIEPDASTEGERNYLASSAPVDVAWRHLEAVADGFRALLPGDETWEEDNIRQTVIGSVSEKKYFARADGRTFSVGLHMLPKLGKLFAPTSLVLSTAKKNVLLTDAGREVSYERRRMGDYPGALLKFESTREGDDYELMEVRLVLVGQRLYVLKASDPESSGDRSDVDRFFESFEVIE
jgi:hypothetical protein